MKIPQKWLVSLFVGALYSGAVHAQTMSFACKATNGLEPQKEFEQFYAGRCDVNGLLQGEGVVRSRTGMLKARFIDGLPGPGPALMSTSWKAFSPREQIGFEPVCKLSFASAVELTEEILCTVQTYSGNSRVMRTWSLSSANGFQVEWVQKERSADGRRIYPGTYLNAKGVLVKAEGPVDLKLARDLQDDHVRLYGGQLVGTVDLNLVSLFALAAGDLLLGNAKVDLKSLSSSNYRPVWLTSISGQFVIRLPTLQITAGENSRYRSTLDKAQLASGHPVDREMTVKYSNGYEATVISTAGNENSFFYFKDNRDVEFSGLIPECLGGRRSPGELRLGTQGWPARYLLTDTEPSSYGNDSNGARRATGNQLVPSGCGMFKTAGNAELRGEFTVRGNNGDVSYAPFKP